MKIRVIWPGKTKQSYYKEAIDDYAARIQKFVPFEIVQTREYARRDKSRADRIKRESAELFSRRTAPVVVSLDSAGNMMTSEELASWLSNNRTDVDFVIGGPEGALHSPNSFKLSFGKITLPHELARVVLLEQIFRALTIIKGVPYHK